jgi:hypothetical protein
MALPVSLNSALSFCGHLAFLNKKLNQNHMIKALAHKGGVRIGKTPKKLASICCP